MNFFNFLNFFNPFYWFKRLFTQPQTVQTEESIPEFQEEYDDPSDHDLEEAAE